MKNVTYEALGAYIYELLKRAHLTNQNVYDAIDMGHSTLDFVKKG